MTMKEIIRESSTNINDVEISLSNEDMASFVFGSKESIKKVIVDGRSYDCTDYTPTLRINRKVAIKLYNVLSTAI